jgi:hypothetical protein
MAKCSYKTRFEGKEWECPLDVITGEMYCYWHNEEDGKQPTDEQLKELKEKEIVGVYLKEANLVEANLRGAKLHGVNFQKANLRSANLQRAGLLEAKLQGTRLNMAKLQGAFLLGVNLQGVNLIGAKLQGTHLWRANLRAADMSGAELQKTFMKDAKLQGANLYGASFDSKTVLNDSTFIGANLANSYFDEAKSFRNATVFQSGNDKEINEIVGDALASWFVWILGRTERHSIKSILKLMCFNIIKVLNKKPCIPLFLKPSVLDVEQMITAKAATKLREKGLVRYVGNDKIIFFNRSSGCVIENPESMRRDEKSLIKVKELTDLILKDGKIQPEFLYKDSRADLYEASYEVYNNLYNFYIANGRLDQAAHVHYRRGETHRKLSWARGGLKNRAKSIFDLMILRFLTGYGDNIARPITVSALIIGVFAALFWHFDGIVKNVNGELATPDWIDYLYHSVTTFTSLGYSNIQPNLAAGHLPQVLVAAESGLGVLMMALIIFVVTYQVSR